METVTVTLNEMFITFYKEDARLNGMEILGFSKLSKERKAIEVLNVDINEIYYNKQEIRISTSGAHYVCSLNNGDRDKLDVFFSDIDKNEDGWFKFEKTNLMTRHLINDCYLEPMDRMLYKNNIYNNF